MLVALSCFFLQFTKKSAVKAALVIPAIKNTPLKLSVENIGLKMMGGKNWPIKRNVVR